MPNIAIPTPDGSFWGLKFHQVAIYHARPQIAVDWWADHGYADWHYDHATLVGEEWGNQSRKTAEMWFNYDSMPMELEYVRYSTGFRNDRDGRDGTPPFISHLSTYVEDVDWEVNRIEKQQWVAPYHRFTTQDHTNPNVVGKKRFKEAIYSTVHMLGYDIKLIQRVPWDYQA